MKATGMLLALAALAGSFTAPAQDRIAPLKIQVGQMAPDFSLPSADGSQVRLSSYRGHGVLLDFYRGYW